MSVFVLGVDRSKILMVTHQRETGPPTCNYLVGEFSSPSDSKMRSR